MERLKRIGTGGWVAVAAVTLAAGAIGYRVIGTADAPETFAAPGSIEELRTQAEANPDDAAAWQRLGFAAFEAGRFDEAAEAYDRATRAAPGSAVLWSSLGEARVMASRRDPMPPEALAAFRRAAELDPADPRARYFLAVEKDLAEDHAGAIADWLALLADTPPGAPWDADLQRTIAQVGAINEIAVEERIEATLAARPAAPMAAMGGIPGPTQEQLAAASSIPPGEQQAMAEGMVARLADRLEREPQDVDGWIMLMRSYKTLRRDGDARGALRSAVAANPGRRAELESAAANLGVT